jgi:hypothetical protein
VCLTSGGARQPHDFGQILSPITRRNALSFREISDDVDIREDYCPPELAVPA